jgi:hypothetical protein
MKNLKNLIFKFNFAKKNSKNRLFCQLLFYCRPLKLKINKEMNFTNFILKKFESKALSIFFLNE